MEGNKSINSMIMLVSFLFGSKESKERRQEQKGNREENDEDKNKRKWVENWFLKQSKKRERKAPGY